MNNDSWIIIADDAPAGSLSLMAKGLGGKVTAVVVGPKKRAKAAAATGVDEVMWFATDEKTPVEAWTQAVAQAVVKAGPRAILAMNLPMARVLVGAAAARLGAAVTSSVTAVMMEKDRVVVKRSVAEGRAVEVLETDGIVAGMIMEGSEDEEAPPVSARIIAVQDVLPKDDIKAGETHMEAGGADLSSAERVVSVGAGIGSRDRIELVRQLADAFHAELSCSLPLCDNYRWFEHSRVVGSSTQRISPRIYLAVGISGQPQHMMGVRGARTIIAVNNDPEAPIFTRCNYGIVGDLNKIVPVLTKALADS